MRTLKHAVLLIILGSLLVPVLRPFWTLGDEVVPAAVWSLVVLSGCANLFPFFYHATSSTHPKYELLPKRRYALKLHVFSGILEIFVGIWAMVSHAAPLPVRIMALLALCLHVPTSLYQTPIVFGAKAVMWPSYLFAIALHAFCAARLFVEPTLYAVVQTFLALHIYVWVRFFYAAFRLFDLFATTLYTSAIVCAGLVITPTILGPLGPLVGLGFILSYIVLYRLLFRPAPAQYRALTRELQMDTLIPHQVAVLFEAEDLESVPDKSDLGAARALFLRLDGSGRGRVDGSEVAPLLAEWELPPRVIEAFVERHSEDGSFDFERFYERIWRIDRLRREAQNRPRARTDREKARIVFAALDLDKSGVLDSFELESLLIEWGLPSADVTAYLARAAAAASTPAGQRQPIDFDVFLRQLEPVWQHGYELLRPDRETDYRRLIAHNIELAVQKMRAPRRPQHKRTYDTVK